MRLPKEGQEERVVGGARRCWVGDRLLYKGYALRHAAGERVGMAELCRRYIEKTSRQDNSAQLDSALQGPDGLDDVAPADSHESEAPIGEDQTMVMVDLGGDLDGLLGSRRRLSAHAQLGEAPGGPVAGERTPAR